MARKQITIYPTIYVGVLILVACALYSAVKIRGENKKLLAEERFCNTDACMI